MTESKALRLITCGLATWRVTSLLVHEKGPFSVFARLREAVSTDDDWQEPSFLGGLLSCFWCTSVWVSVLVALIARSPLRWVLMPFALSGVAILIEQVGANDGD